MNVILQQKVLKVFLERHGKGVLGSNRSFFGLVFPSLSFYICKTEIILTRPILLTALCARGSVSVELRYLVPGNPAGEWLWQATPVSLQPTWFTPSLPCLHIGKCT